MGLEFIRAYSTLTFSLFDSWCEAENRKLLHEQNVEKVLVELLSVADISVQTATCQAVSVMSFHLASKDSFRDLGGIPAVVQLLNNESLVLKEAAAQPSLTSHIATSSTCCDAVYEAGGHEVLVQQLNGSCLRTLANSAATLGNMAAQEVIRCSILSLGAVKALMEPLNSTDTQLLVNTTRCLAVLTCDTEARAELQSAGGLHPLVNLLRSYHKEVLHNACWAISVCARDGPAAVEMCTFGALEMLQEINQSVNRRSRFSELAMISLLNSNLSAKYSLTSHLASTDLICDGFYDAGKVCSCRTKDSDFRGNVKAAVNEHRPIIVRDSGDRREAEQRIRNRHQQQGRAQDPRKKKEEDKQKDEPLPESPTEKPWKMMDDVSLQLLIKEAKESIIPLTDEREQCAALARLVSEAMGGAVEMERLHEYPWVLHLSELKFQLQANCLADCIGVSCTLVRGEYNRAWNEVLLFNRKERPAQPCRYTVDLMHQPGSLLAPNTLAAVQYQTI
ncbi:hypothetical protein F7725_028573 [Dissostichus mawsoni]|uniref:Uncharacterized protein n=1 Tax=Dissostichus mawsoni TaxID=36200 RepID=A0A7J5XG24_DISMA|nr:hypothetical protein F7725_028573 [Dissostichus mawsoni]